MLQNETSLSVSRGLLSLFFSIILFFFNNNCEEQSDYLTNGEDYLQSQTELILIDTFSVDLSTILLDSVVTSGKNVLLIGAYQDTTFGEITSTSYFQLGVPQEFNSENIENDEYKSLELVLTYNNYSFGDTTKNQNINVYQLNENIEKNENEEVTSNTSFDYNSNPIGSIIYRPKPKSSSDTLAIEINDEIGQDLFKKMQEDSEVLKDNEMFIDYFHGLALIPEESNSASIVGFKATEMDLKLILHTKNSGATEKTINYEFCLLDSSKQFNNIKHDLANTKLNDLSDQEQKLQSTSTAGKAYLQNSLGLAIRVDFPTLKELLLFENRIIKKVELSIAPLANNNERFDLPSDLNLYQADKQNDFSINYDYVSYSNLYIDELYNEDTRYLFDITYYIKDELSDSYIDPEKGLIINVPQSSYNTNLSRFIADAKNQNTELKIYFLSY